MTDKSIKLNFSVDQQSAQQAKTLISEIVSSFEKLINVAGKLNLGGQLGQQQPGQGPKTGANPQDKVIAKVGGVGQGLIQGLADQRTVFQSIATGSKTALTSMSDALKRSVADQKRELESLSRSLEEAGKHYQTLNRLASTAAEGPEQMARHASARDKFAELMEADILRYDKVQKEITRKEEAISNIGGVIGPPPGGVGGAGGSEERKGEARARAFEAAIAGKVVSSAVQQIGGAIQQAKFTEMGNFAAMQQAGPGRFLQSMLRGDYSDVYFSRRKDLEEKYMGRKALIGEAAGAVGEQAFTGLASAAMMGTGVGAAAKGAQVLGQQAMNRAATMQASGGIFSNATGAVTGALSSFKWGGIETQELLARNQGLDIEKAADPLTMAMFDQLNAEKVMRAQAARRLAGQHMGARGTGAGYGYTFGESIGMAESLRDVAGMKAMMSVTTGGVAGRRINLMEGYQKILASKDIPESTKMAAAGRMAILGLQGGNLEDVTIGGRPGQRQRGLLESTMQLASMGIKESSAIQGLTGIYEAFGGGGAAKSEKAMKVLEDAIRTGIGKGYEDPRTKDTLVSYIGEATSKVILGDKDRGGIVALSQFLGAGSTGQLSARQADARAQVMGGLGNLYSGNQFFTGAGIAVANQIMGPGASAADRQLLVKAMQDPNQLLTGGRGLDLIGLGGEQNLGKRTDILRRQANIVMAEHMRDQGSAVNQAWMAAGGDVTKFLHGGGAIGGLSRKDIVEKAMLTSKTFGRTEELARASAEMFGGIDEVTGVAGKAKIKKFGDAAAMAAISMEEQTKMKLMGEEAGKQLAKEMRDFMKKLTPEEMVKAIKEAGEQKQKLDFESGKSFIVTIGNEIGRIPVPVPPGKNAATQGRLK